MSTRDDSQSAEWRRHWPLVLAAFLGYSFASCIYQALGLFIAPLTKEFGWSQTQITSGASIAAMIGVPLAPIVGAAIDRWGGRRVALPGLICVMLAMASMSLANGSSVQWMAIWAVYGVVAAFLNTTVWTYLVIGAFKAGRSLAISVALSGATFAGAIAPPLTQWLTDSLGWRNAFLWLGFGWGGAALVMSLLFLANRHEVRHRSGTQSSSGLPGLSMKEAARSIPLLRIGLATLLIMTIGSILVVHRVPLLTEAGVSRATAAQLAGLSGLAGILGKLVTGWGMQKWDAGWVGGLAIGAMGIALLLLFDGFRTPTTIVVSMVVIGFAGGAKLQIAAYLTSVYAGARNFGKIFGVTASIIALAGGLGPVLGGMAHDMTGNYNLVILVGIPCCLLGAALLIRLGDHPDWSVPNRTGLAERSGP